MAIVLDRRPITAFSGSWAAFLSPLAPAARLTGTRAARPPVRTGRETQPLARRRPIQASTPGCPGPKIERKTAMAEVLPNSRRQTIEWFESRISTWAKDPGAIGLTS